MRYLLILSIAVYSYAGLLDFNYLNKAKDAYSKGDYANASQNYGKVNSDEAKYDQANSLYKQKKYKEALALYNSISDKNLEFKKLHNMGNTLAHLSKTDEAIKAYENALKIQDDKDTKFNLELLKKQKEDKKKKKDNKQKQDKKDSQKQKSQKDNKNENKKSDKKSQEKSQKESQEKPSDNKKKRENTKPKEKKDTKEQKQKQQKVKKDKKKGSQKPQQAKNQPISNMEERKWQKMLNQKQINTLMLPIRKGETNNEKTPW